MESPQSKNKSHEFKYSLVYIRDGKRLIGYDNAEGKGDHKHYKHKEYAYHFTDMDALIIDFYDDVEKIRRGAL